MISQPCKCWLLINAYRSYTIHSSSAIMTSHNGKSVEIMAMMPFPASSSGLLFAARTRHLKRHCSNTASRQRPQPSSNFTDRLMKIFDRAELFWTLFSLRDRVRVLVEWDRVFLSERSFHWRLFKTTEHLIYGTSLLKMELFAGVAVFWDLLYMANLYHWYKIYLQDQMNLLWTILKLDWARRLILVPLFTRISDICIFLRQYWANTILLPVFFVNGFRAFGDKKSALSNEAIEQHFNSVGKVKNWTISMAHVIIGFSKPTTSCLTLTFTTILLLSVPLCSTTRMS